MGGGGLRGGSGGSFDEDVTSPVPEEERTLELTLGRKGLCEYSVWYWGGFCCCGFGVDDELRRSGYGCA